MSEDRCATCRLVVPLNGYICEFCVHAELQRIRELPEARHREALENLDRRQYGYVRTQQERLDHAQRAMERLRDRWGIPAQE